MAGASPVAAVDALAALAEVANNRSVPTTMSVALSPCDTDSDSMLRFTAYMSVVYGAQALWWEGVGACAPIGSAKFELIAAIKADIDTAGRALTEPEFVAFRDSKALVADGAAADENEMEPDGGWGVDNLMDMMDTAVSSKW